MTINKSSVQEIIRSSIGEMNESLADEKKVEKSLNLILYGSSSSVDSLSFVGLIVSIEDSISSAYGVELDIMELIENDVNTVDTAKSLLELLSKNL